MIGKKEPATKSDFESSETPIWRYTSLAKLVNILRRGDESNLGELVFRRADLLDDEYEGTLPKEHKNYWRDLWNTVDPAEVRVEPEEVGAEAGSDDVDLLVKSTEVFHQRMRKLTYLNCWRQDEYESSSMWRAYTSPTDGVAIKSNMDDFISAFRSWDHRLFIVEVEYKDFDSVETEFPDGFLDLTALSPYNIKRSQFKDEREVRAIITKYDHPELYVSGNLESVEKTTHKENQHATVDFEELVDEIVVHPESNPYLKKIVEDILSKYNLSPELVTVSSLTSESNEFTE